MRLIFTFLTFVLIIVSTLNLGAQERYWVNGDGNWNDNSHWAETSGGEGGASVPELEDLVIFDKKSGNPEVSVNGIFFSQSIDFQSKAKFVYANNSKIYSNELVNNSNLRNENGEISLLKSDDTKAVFSVVCSRVDETCPGYCDGSITVDVDFGTPNFPVTLILNADNSCATADQSLVINSFPYTFSNICGCGAAYSIIAIDSDNFMIGCEATVVGKAPMNPFENITDESCFGVCDGQIMISIVFPIAGAPYTYDWSPNGFTGDGTNTYSDLCDGDYDVLLTDKDGCQETFTYTVNGPALLTISMDSTNVTCNGFCNGTSTVTANGGTPPYSYDWSPDGSTGDGTDTYSDLCPGAYSVTVTDDNGCTETDGNSITEPVVLDANIINHTDVVCGGASDGTANAAPTGGTTPYSYQWSQGTGSNTPNVTDLAGPGWTYLTVTDANLCQHVDSVYIDAPLSVVSVTVNGIIDVLCNGDCNGQATANGAGGTPPYTYLWESGETSNPALALCAGNQNVTIYDANLCPATETFVVGEPTVLTAAIGAFTNISCNGLCDGSATVNVGGGTTPYTYLWDNAEITNPSIALCVGATDVLVTDDNGCTASTTANITEPTAINVSLNTSTNISCNGICDGSATLTVSGGTAPYDFEWGNGETTNPATALCAGNTDVTVTDDNGCSVTFSVNLTEPDPIVINVLATTDVLCFGDCNGSATLGIVGGTPAYTIGWGNGESANPATALCGGNTDVTVTDANNCTATQTVNIVEPPVITIALLVSTDASCNGVCDGSATLNVGGGT
ncbi:MAG: SprB repeat-containing protein, partial [Bacteroidales bacterium]|nr:SprB repeat-containing protein [Bacteroidales bacterium]